MSSVPPSVTPPRTNPFRITLRADGDITFSPGERIGINIIKRLIGSRWLVGVGGKTLRATADVPLQPGQRLRASVALEGGRVVLRSLPDKGEALPEEAIARGSPQHRELATAMVRSGLLLSPALYKKLLRVVKTFTSRAPERRGSGEHQRSAPPTESSAHERTEKIRLLTIAFRKGLSLTSEQLDRVRAAPPATRSGAHHPHHFDGDSESPSKETHALSEALRRVVNEGGGAHRNSLLPLFNHLADGGDKNDHWLLIPYSLPPLQQGGHLRLRLSGDPPHLTEAVIMIEDSVHRADRWYVSLSQFNSKQRRATLHIPDSRERRVGAAAESNFKETMSALGFQHAAVVIGDPSFDGFSSALSSGATPAVDIRV